MTLLKRIADVFSNPMARQVIAQPLNSEKDLLLILEKPVVEQLIEWSVWAILDADPVPPERTLERAKIYLNAYSRPMTRALAKRLVLRYVRHMRATQPMIDNAPILELDKP